MNEAPEREPLSELFRMLKLSRAKGYDRLLEQSLPIPVERVGQRYFVFSEDLQRLKRDRAAKP
jgi:hypothetical protein